MGGIKVSIVLWITFLILTESSYDKIEEKQDWEEGWEQEEDWKKDWEELSCDKNNYTGFADEIKAQSLEECRNNNFLLEDLDKQKLKEHKPNLKRKQILPNCVPNFFIPALEPCVCIGSGKTIEENEVGILYCFPQPNKFKAKIGNEFKMISTPEKYEDNMVPNEQLKSCAPNRESSVEEVCFCGSEKDKKKLQDDAYDGNHGFVNLKHICLPLHENEKTHGFSLLTPPHQKLPYCYRDQCHRNPLIIERNLIGHILDLAAVSRTLLKYFTLIERIRLAGIDRYTRLEIQRSISADGEDIARILTYRNKRILCTAIEPFERNLLHSQVAKWQYGFSCIAIQPFDTNILQGKSFFSLPANTKLPSFEITLRNPEINRFFPIFATLKFSFTVKQFDDKGEELKDKYLNVGIKKVEEFGKIIFYVCSKLSTTYFDQNDIEFKNQYRPKDFSIKFDSEEKNSYLHTGVEKKDFIQNVHFEGEKYELKSIWFEAKASTSESTIRFNADLYKFFSLIKN